MGRHQPSGRLRVG